jgi:hypothetical protein
MKKSITSSVYDGESVIFVMRLSDPLSSFWGGVELRWQLLRPLLAYCTSPSNDDRWWWAWSIWWNGWQRKPKYSDKNLPHCCFVHHKSHDCIQAPTTTAMTGSRQLTAWAMAQPYSSTKYLLYTVQFYKHDFVVNSVCFILVKQVRMYGRCREPTVEKKQNILRYFSVVTNR